MKRFFIDEHRLTYWAIAFPGKETKAATTGKPNAHHDVIYRCSLYFVTHRGQGICARFYDGRLSFDGGVSLLRGIERGMRFLLRA